MSIPNFKWMILFAQKILAGSQNFEIASFMSVPNFTVKWGTFYARGKLKGSVKEPNILIYFFFPPIIQSCSVSDLLFTGGRGVSDFTVLKYYWLNSINILNECLRILIDRTQLSKTYYNILFGSFTRDRHARRRIYRRTFRE